MENKNGIHIHYWLMPLAWLYGLVTGVRNWLFDRGLLSSRAFPLPVICVGNITVGGTGKTPHTEYLIRLLSPLHQVAVLSRGYKRGTRGFLLASPEMTAREVGDEPRQMKGKFPFIHMAVDCDRCHGIDLLTRPEVTPPVDVVLLDDAFQHRHVRAGLNILLVDYNRPILQDRLLPAGRLRESARGRDRADVVVVTKCPPRLDPGARDTMARALRPDHPEQVFFTRYSYPDRLDGLTPNPLLVTGVAQPRQIARELRRLVPEFEVMSFPDHHPFSPADIEAIRRRAGGRAILTTEKDATRLCGLDRVVVIPIRVCFADGRGEEFDRMIMQYVERDRRK